MNLSNTTIGIFILAIATTLSIFRLNGHISAHAEYSNLAGSYWDLAEKSSTIKDKSTNIDLFVYKLESLGLQNTNSALIYKTINTDFNKNFAALKTFQSRLHSIDTMNVNSFAYQTAIQQITQQEQGEADDMLSVFSECYYKVHYYFYYNLFIIIGFFILEILLFTIGFAILVEG